MRAAIKMESPIGTLAIEEENGRIIAIDLREHEWTDSTPLLDKTKHELEQYFKGERRNFDVPLNECGTVFQKKVWAALRTIPYGKTVSYGELAKLIGSCKASRAVGNACNKNPILIINPCHRVIGSDGKLIGFACGLDKKEMLLKLEGRL